LKKEKKKRKSSQFAQGIFLDIISQRITAKEKTSPFISWSIETSVFLLITLPNTSGAVYRGENPLISISF